MGQRRCVSLGVAILLRAASAHAATFHVATTGDNANNGSATTPWQTIQHCADLAQPGDVCRAHSGTYRETVVVRRSGVPGAPIRFEAAPGECATVSGADVLTGAWSQYSGSIWVMSTNKQFIQLFSAGKELNEARWPNADPADLVHMPMAKADAGSDTNGVVATGAPPGDWTGAMVLVVPGLQWWSYTRHIAAYDQVSQRLTFKDPIPETPDLAPALVPKQNSRYYLYGSLLALDSEGEWFLDTAAGRLYLWPSGGVNPSSLSIEVKQRNWAFDVTNQSYIEIAGFRTFAAAIRLNSSSHCTVDGVRSSYVSAMRETNGWTLPPDDVPVIIGDFNVWKNSVIAYSAASGLFVHGNDNLVANNIIHDVDTVALSRAGIEFATWEPNARNVIAYNTISRSGWAGIGMTGASNCRTVFNRITDSALLVHDAGSLYAGLTDGENSEIAWNEMSHAPCKYCTGVYLDEGARNFVVHHNFLHDIAWFGGSFRSQNAFFNNTVVAAGRAPFTMISKLDGSWDAVATATVLNNLLEGSTGMTVTLHLNTVTDFHDYGAPVLVTPEWRHVVVPFSSLTQDFYANPVPLDLRVAQFFQFFVETPGDSRLELDNPRLEGPVPMLLADFESGLGTTLGTQVYDFAGSGSSASLALRSVGAACSRSAAELTVTQSIYGYNGMSIFLSSATNGTLDLSAYTGISFDVRARSRFWMSTQYQVTSPLAPVQGFNFACPVDANQVPTTYCALGKAQPIAGYVAAGADLGAFQSGSPSWTAGAQFSESPESCDAPRDVVMNLPPAAPYPATPTGSWPAPTLDPQWSDAACSAPRHLPVSAAPPGGQVVKRP